MKNTFLAIILSLVALAAGCKPSEEVSQKTTSEQLDKIKMDAKETAQDLKDYSFAQKAEFTEAMSRQVAAINAKLDLLADRIEKSSEAAKAEAKPKLQALREQVAALNTKLDDVKNATESTWDKVKIDTKKAADGINDAFQESRQWLSEKIAP